MGIDADKIHTTPLGRPVQIVNGGKKIDMISMNLSYLVRSGAPD